MSETAILLMFCSCETYVNDYGRCGMGGAYIYPNSQNWIEEHYKTEEEQQEYYARFWVESRWLSYYCSVKNRFTGLWKFNYDEEKCMIIDNETGDTIMSVF